LQIYAKEAEMKTPSTLETLLLAGGIVIGSIPGLILGQTNQSSQEQQNQKARKIELQNQACIPYAPSFCPDREDWNTIWTAERSHEPRVVPINGNGVHEIFRLGCYTGTINIKADYFSGKNGGSGGVRAFIYLDDQSIMRAISLKSVKAYPISIDETNLSTKTYEVDVNEKLRIVASANTEEMRAPSFSLGSKIEDVVEKGVQIILKAAGAKLTLSDIDAAKKLFEYAFDYQRTVDEQRVTQRGNHLAGGFHVYTNPITKTFLGFPDLNPNTKIDDGLIQKKVPVYVIEINQGEEAIVALILDIELVGYRQAWRLGVRDSYRTITGFRLPVAAVVDSLRKTK
jgi:hypothetical protein